MRPIEETRILKAIYEAKRTSEENRSGNSPRRHHNQMKRENLKGLWSFEMLKFRPASQLIEAFITGQGLEKCKEKTQEPNSGSQQSQAAETDEDNMCTGTLRWIRRDDR
jgi:hypothetical protein